MRPQLKMTFIQFKFISELYLPSWPGKIAKPPFCKYQCETNNDKFPCCWESHSEINVCRNLYEFFKAVVMRLKSNSYPMSISNVN